MKDNGVNDSKEAWSVSHIFVWPFAFALIHLHLYTSVRICMILSLIIKFSEY